MEIRKARVRDLEPEIEEMYDEMTSFHGTKKKICELIIENKNDGIYEKR